MTILKGGNKMTKISFNITAILTIVLPLVFILGNEQFINNYIAIYGINFFIFLIIIAITIIVRLKSLNSRDFKSRIINFTKYFIGYFLFSSLFFVIFKYDNFDIVRIIAISFGFSFGTNFFDLLFKKTKNKNLF